MRESTDDRATTMWVRLKAALLAIIGMSSLCWAMISYAAYPDKTIRVIYPWSAGSAGDTATRLFAEELGKRVGVPVVVENKPGANGIIGTQWVVTQPADGYTLLITSSEPLVVNPNVYAKLSYDVERDLEPIAIFGRSSFAFAASERVPADNVKSLIALAKKSPGKYSVATFGIADLFLASFESATGTEFLRVPFQGGQPAMSGVLGGHVDTIMVASATATQYLNTGKIKLLAIGSASRLKSLPDVPTFIEQGVDGFEIGNWYSVTAPRGIPVEAQEVLQKAIADIVSSPAFAERMNTAAGMEVEYRPPAKFRDYLRQETSRWATIVREKNIPKQ
jgi:tripartite-type tricarboxylate transporter receptor subunit TctC